MGTGATMLIKNQCQGQVTTSLSNVNCMYENGDDGSHLESFGDMNIAPYTNSSGVYIEAKGTLWSGCATSQSSFSIGLSGGPIGNSTLGIDLGTGPVFQTAITNNTNPSQFNAMLAPGAPVESGISYNFFFYAGPGITQDYINSVIQANLPALVNAALLGKQINIGPVGFTFSTLNGLDSINCSYSAVTPDATGTGLNFTAKIDTGNLEVTGTVAAGKYIGTTFDITTNNLSIAIEGTLAFTNNKPTVSITLLQTSLVSYTINGSIMNLPFLSTLFQIIKTFATGPDLAGLINANFNSQILSVINQFLQNI